MSTTTNFTVRRCITNIFNEIPLYINVEDRRYIRQYIITSCKQTIIRSQIRNLLHLKKEDLLPMSIFKMHIPDILQGRTYIDTSTSIQALPPRSYKRMIKTEKKLHNAVTSFRRNLLIMMISTHFCDLSDTTHTESQLKTLAVIKKHSSTIHKHLEHTKSELTKEEDDRHARKKCIIITSQTKTYTTPRPHVETLEYPGVLCLSQSEECTKLMPLLDKGRNFKVAPTNMKNLHDETVIGVQRLICGMKYANPAWKEGLPLSSYDTDPLTPITSRFDRDLHKPPQPTSTVEDQIEKLKVNIKPALEQLKKVKVHRNVDPKNLDLLKTLKKDPNQYIGLSDKTNKIVTISPSIVKEKIFQHLENTQLFREVPKDPSVNIEKLGRDLLNSIQPTLLNSNEKIFKRLYSTDSTAPILQPLLKDHKAGFPHCNIRPVQPVTNSAVEKIDLLVSRVLTQITPLLSYRAKDATEFKTRLRSLNTPPAGSFMTSLDIVNMYPSMPTNERAMQVIGRYLETHQNNINLFGLTVDHIIQLLTFVLKNTYISYNNRFFIQESGVGTGNHSSGPYAEIIVDWTYEEAMMVTNMRPRGLTLYVDDAWMLWCDSRNRFDLFKAALNKIWATVKFEEEMEGTDKSINFLDLTITRTAEGLKYTFFQKSTNSGRYLHFTSHCAISTKLNIIKSETRRVINNCSDPADAYPHLEKIKKDFLNSGYPPTLINSTMLESIHKPAHTNTSESASKYILKVPYISEVQTRLMRKVLRDSGVEARLVVTSGRSIKSLIKPTTDQSCSRVNCYLCSNNMPCKTTHYVYELTCASCPEENYPAYIGCSRRCVPKRMGQHEASVRRRNDENTPADHMLTTHPLPDSAPPVPRRGKPDFPSFFSNWKPQILRKCRDTLDAYLWEGLKINQLKPSINKYPNNGFTDF